MRWSLVRPRANRGQVIVAVLCLLVGFAAAAQVRSNDDEDKFATARQDELVVILSDLTQRSDRLNSDVRELQETKERLRRDTQGEAAVAEARRRAATYGILAGTLPASGPGIELTISGQVPASVMLDALQELRDAGAEVIQVGQVRLGVDSYFTDDTGGGISVDGRPLRSPYRFLAIGDPHTLATALKIPGGIMKTLNDKGAKGAIAERHKININATRQS